MSRPSREPSDGGTTRRTPEPRGAVETLQWCGEFLSRRAEVFGPVIALGALGALLSAGPLVGIPLEAVSAIRLFVYLPASVLVAGTIALAVADDLGGRLRSIGEYASEATENLLSGIVVSITVGIVVGIGLVFLIVPGLYFLVRFAFAIPSVFVDGRGITEGLKESWNRTKGYGWNLFGIIVLLGIVSLVSQAVSLLESPLMMAVVSGLVTVVVTPFAIGSFTYLYLTTKASETGTPQTRSQPRGQQRQTPAGQSPPPQSTPAERGGGRGRSGGQQSARGGTGQPRREANRGHDQRQAENREAQASGRGAGRPERGGAERRPTEGRRAGTSRPGSEQPQSEPRNDRRERPTEGQEQPARSAGGPSDTERDEPNGERRTAPNRTPEAGGGEGSDARDADLPSEETARIAQLTDEVDAGEAGPGRVGPLIELLDSEFPAVRREAATALGTLGSRYPNHADDAVDALQDVRLDPDTEVSEAASNAVRRIKESR